MNLNFRWMMMAISVFSTSLSADPVGLKVRDQAAIDALLHPPKSAKVSNFVSGAQASPSPAPTATSRTLAATSIQQSGLYCLDRATSFTSDAFLTSIGASSTVKSWYAQGYRPNLQGLTRTGKPVVQFVETSSPSFLAVLQPSNSMVASFRTGADFLGWSWSAPLSPGFDCGVLLGDYAGLVASWLIGTNLSSNQCTEGFPNNAISTWRTNSLIAVNNGLSAWVAYLNDQNSEVYKYASNAIRRSGDRPCDTYNYPDCFKGNNIQNVMMNDPNQSVQYPSGAYPFAIPSNLTSYDGPVTWDLAGIYFAAILYDIANEVGLGKDKTNQLAWKTLSMITQCTTFTLQDYGAYLLQAANALWPNPNTPGLSYYDATLKDLLRSRGIAVGSESSFTVNLPAAIGASTSPPNPAPLAKISTSNFGSSHPDAQPGEAAYGVYNYFDNAYTHPGALASDHMVYQFYKHSKYGPCDKLVITDGTFTDAGAAVSYNGDGTYYYELKDRSLQNLLLMVPGPKISWNRMRMRCADEHTGFYAEDVRPFGFRVIKAVKNGFVWRTTRTYGSIVGKIRYVFSAVDPKFYLGGTYTWRFTDYTGVQTTLAGGTVTYDTYADQPVTISVSRLRSGVTETVTMVEPGSLLDSTDRPHWLIGIKTADNSVGVADKKHYFNLFTPPPQPYE